MSTTPQHRARYDFFREHAGGIVGRNAIGALDLARAEELLDEAEELDAARFQWVDDEEPYDHGVLDAATVARYFDENRWTGPYGAVLEIGDDPGTHAHGRPWSSSSLWGVVLNSRGTDDPYARVVRAELASELADELRAAIMGARVRSLADELAARVGHHRAADELRGVLDTIEQEAGR